MKNSFSFFLVICLSFLSLSWAGSLPVLFHAGRLDSLERVLDSRRFIQKEQAIRQNRLLPKDDDSDLIEECAPDAEQAFIILSIAVYPGRSIAPTDYLLQTDGIEYPCLGMALKNKQIFDFRLLEKNGPAEVLLIFSCPANARGATLKCAYTEMPIPAISGLILQEPEPEPEPEPAAPEPAEAANETPAEN
jgi:hypothetical protein